MLVSQHASEFTPGSVADCPGKATVSQHPGHIQVFDDDPVVGLDQLVRYPMEEMAANISYPTVVPPQSGCGIASVPRSFLFAGHQFRQMALFPKAGVERFGCVGDAAGLAPIAGSRNQERGQSEVDAHPATLIAADSGSMVVRGV
ncbi:hypothetical protein FMUBM48_52910 [Nocardia cyriacigeorgica]|nr:hypothetical protein FMUBM48_52910 [Nocardia cyriacigeorgica]